MTERRISRRGFIKVFPYYLAGAGVLLTGCDQEWLRNPVGPKQEGQVRVAVVGDIGNSGKNGDRVAMMVRSWEPDAVVSAGDNNHREGSRDSYDEALRQYGWAEKIFYPALGNHDWGPGYPSASIPLLEKFPSMENRRYYTVKLGQGLLDIFILDSDIHEPDGTSAGSKQALWLKDGLLNSSAIYKLVVAHHPPFSPCDFDDNEGFQWPYAEWGADALITAHCHVYARGMIGNFPYFTNGLGGGVRNTPFNAGSKEDAVRYDDGYGAMLIEADTTAMDLRFISQGRVIDDYTIYPDRTGFR